MQRTFDGVSEQMTSSTVVKPDKCLHRVLKSNSLPNDRPVLLLMDRNSVYGQTKKPRMCRSYESTWIRTP